MHITGTREADAYGDDLAGLEYHRLNVVDTPAVDELADRLNTLHILVYSAGAVAYQRAEYNIETFRRVVEVNLIGAMSCCTAVHPTLARADDAGPASCFPAALSRSVSPVACTSPDHHPAADRARACAIKTLGRLGRRWGPLLR